MASGFITLPDGKDWSARWSRYDYVLETIMDRLEDTGEQGYLKRWLQFILPDEKAGDIESGWCFYKKMADGEESFESVLRILDTNSMKEQYFRIFWDTVAQLAAELDPDEDVGFLINQLHREFVQSLSSEKAGRPLKEYDAEDSILNIGGFRIGK